MLLAFLSAAVASPLMADVSPGCRCTSVDGQPLGLALTVLAVGMVVLGRRAR
jgi:MYXO-CTERM domain-containing protein